MGEEIFVRKASGLVRNVSAWDALVMCILIPGIFWPWVYQMWAVGLHGPGVWTPLAALIAIAFMIPNAIMYVMFSVAMPRSGGDYVWVSRIIHPAVGFAVNWYITLILLSWAGPFASWIVEWGIAPIWLTWGTMIGDPTGLIIFNMLNINEVKLAIGTVIIIVMAILSLLGSKWEFRAEWLAIIMGYIGLMVWAGVMIAGAPLIDARMQLLTGGALSFATIVSTASGAGWVVTAALPIGLGVTFFATTYTTLNFLGYTNSAYIAGEIKGVTRSHIIAIIGALFIFGFTAFGLYAVNDYALGPVVLNSLAYLDVAGDPLWWNFFPIEPLGSILSMFATDIPFIPPFLTISFAFGCFGAALGLFISSVRNIFAWSFDRVLPSSLSKVDSRFRAPWVAIIVTFIICFIMNFLYIYTTALDYFTYSILAWWIAMVIIGIAGIIFPWRRKDIFDLAPDFAKKKIFGIPLISIFSAISIPISVFIGYASVSPAVYGTIDWSFMIAVVVTFIIAPIIYYISYFYHKSKGISIAKAQAEIPPE
jgi:amino acid transporter